MACCEEVSSKRGGGKARQALVLDSDDDDFEPSLVAPPKAAASGKRAERLGLQPSKPTKKKSRRKKDSDEDSGDDREWKPSGDEDSDEGDDDGAEEEDASDDEPFTKPVAAKHKRAAQPRKRTPAAPRPKSAASAASSSTAPVDAELHIDAAWYGNADDVWGDSGGEYVTAQAQALVTNGVLHLNPDMVGGWYNERFGDTAPGVAKVVAIRYRYGEDGVPQEVVGLEASDERSSLLIDHGGAAVNKTNKTGAYFVEYAKTGRATCQVCGEKIALKEARIGLEVEDKSWGLITRWQHVRCTRLPELHGEPDGLSGFDALAEPEQAAVREMLQQAGTPAHLEFDPDEAVAKACEAWSASREPPQTRRRQKGWGGARKKGQKREKRAAEAQHAVPELSHLFPFSSFFFFFFCLSFALVVSLCNPLTNESLRPLPPFPPH